MASQLPDIPEISSAAEIIEIEHQGHTIAVLRPELRVSDGPRVAFIPGILSDVTLWPRILPSDLRNRWDWASVSLPCHYPSRAPGEFESNHVTIESIAELVAAALHKAFGDEPVHLVGWSTGGFASLVTASLFPSRVRTVTSISGFVRGKWGSLPGFLQRLARLGRTGKWVFAVDLRVLSSLPGLYKRIYRWLAASSPVGDELDRAFPAVASCVNQSDRRHLAQLFAGLRSIDATRHLCKITCPVALLGGLRDRVITSKEFAHIQSHVNEAKTLELEQCGHLFFWEQPKMTWRFVERFLEENA